MERTSDGVKEVTAVGNRASVLSENSKASVAGGDCDARPVVSVPLRGCVHALRHR